MKITFKAKIVADVSNDPRYELIPTDHKYQEPTLDWVGKLLVKGSCDIELVPSFDSSAEPTLIITEKKDE